VFYSQSKPSLIFFHRNKQQHSCGKTIGLLIALVSYALALTLIIGDLFFDSPGKRDDFILEKRDLVALVFGHMLHHFHAHTDPLVPPQKWIAPLWMTVYGLQVRITILLFHI
jgi:hypothetical protein